MKNFNDFDTSNYTFTPGTDEISEKPDACR